MTKEEYMITMAKELKRLPKKDFDTAMEYFEEYFQEAGEENEQQAIEDLGTPKEAACQILQNIVKRQEEEPTRNVKQGISKVWVGVLAVFAAPVAIPLAIGVVAAIGSLFICAGAVAAAVVLTGAGGAAAGLVSLAAGIFLLFTNLLSGISNIGAGLILIGISVLIIMGGIKLFKWLAQGCARALGSIARKGGKENEK